MWYAFSLDVISLAPLLEIGYRAMQMRCTLEIELGELREVDEFIVKIFCPGLICS